MNIFKLILYLTIITIIINNIEIIKAQANIVVTPRPDNIVGGAGTPQSTSIKGKQSASAGRPYKHSHESAKTFFDPNKVLKEIPFAKFYQTMADADRWRLSGDVATYLNMSRIESIYIPINVNLIFVGFNGDGNKFINLEAQEIYDTFSHLDHIMRHVKVPVFDSQITTEKFPQEESIVKYQFFTDVILLDPLVNTIVEDAIYWQVRPDSQVSSFSPDAPDYYYIEAGGFSTMLNDLLSYLHLDSSYTIFILNPKNSLSGNEVYGYRAGFSNAELEEIRAMEPIFDGPIKPHKHVAPKPSGNILKQDKDNVRIASYKDKSREWAMEWVKEGKEQSARKRVECRHDNHDSDDDDEIESGCVKFFHRSSKPLSINDLVHQIEKNGSNAMKRYIQRIQLQFEDSVQEQCLVDSWIGNGRYAWIDLSAGPFHWGPIISPDGVRTPLNLIPASIGEKSNNNNNEFMKMKAPANQDKNQKLETLKEYYNRCIDKNARNSTVCVELKKKIEAMAEPHDENPLDEIIGSDEEGELARKPEEIFMMSLSAVISNSLKYLIASPTPSTSSMDDVTDPFHFTTKVNFNVFYFSESGEFELFDDLDYGSLETEMKRFQLPSQDFTFSLNKIKLSNEKEVSVAFNSALRLEVIPSLNLNQYFELREVRFLDSKAFRERLLSSTNDVIKSSHSKLHGNAHHHHQAHSSVIESEVPLNRFSLGMHHEFRQRDIPIFVFAVDGKGETPLLVDRHYQSRGLPDMVVAVQSTDQKWRSRLQCNSHSIFWDLRSPMKSILGSVALTYSGLIASHMHYNWANQRPEQNWQWSVGDHPYSHTSSNFHSHFTQFQRDNSYRNFLIHALASSAATVNAGIEDLAKLETESNFDSPLKNEFTLIKNFYQNLKLTWIDALSDVERLDFERALLKLRPIEAFSVKFRTMIDEIRALYQYLRCLPSASPNQIPATRAEKLEEKLEDSSETAGKGNNWFFPLTILVDVLLILLFIIFRQRRKNKVKIN